MGTGGSNPPPSADRLLPNVTACFVFQIQSSAPKRIVAIQSPHSNDQSATGSSILRQGTTGFLYRIIDNSERKTDC